MNLELLPQGARDIVAALGVSDAITVLSVLAGTRWAVPNIEHRNGKTGVTLVKYLGEPLALKLMTAFGGEALSIPRCQKALNSVRDAQIIARYEQLCREGMSVRAAQSELALIYRMTATYVGKIVERVDDPRSDPNQLPLF
ncbi:MAG: Mor transcription activator family protein [Aeromonas veronii]